MKRLNSSVFILALLFVAVCSNVQAQRDRRTPSGTPAIAKNVVAVLAEPSREIANDGFHFIIDAGTRILVFDKFSNKFGNLALTENGLWGFIPQNAYWTKFSPEDFNLSNEIIFAARQNTVKLDEFISFNFSPSTVYELISETDTHFQIFVDGNGYQRISNEKFETKVPKTPFRKIHNGKLKRKNVDFFARANIDGLIGMEKHCNQSYLVKRNFRGGGSLGINLKFASIDVGINSDASYITAFDGSKFVVVSYFSRSNSNGIYKIVRMEECEKENRGQIWFEYYRDNGTRLVIDKKFIDEYNLPFHTRTHQIVISCYEQFDKYLRILEKHESYSKDEALFIISRTARWIGHGNIRNCDRS